MKPKIAWLSASLKILADATARPKRFEILAYTGGKLNVEGVPVPVVVELDSLTHRDGFSVILNHKPHTENTLGQVDRVENDGETVTIGGPITGSHQPPVRDVLLQAANGHKWEASIGCRFEPDEALLVDAGQEMTVNGQTLAGPFLLARNAVLRETSILSMGADPNTRVNLAAAAALLKGMAMSFEDFCKSLGVDPAAATPELLAVLQSQYDAAMAAEAEGETSTEEKPADVAAEGETSTEEKPADMAAEGETSTEEKKPDGAQAGGALNLKATLDQRRKAIVADEQRSRAIRALEERFPNHTGVVRAVADTAILKGWSIDKAKAEMYERVNRTGGPAGHSHSHEGTFTLNAMMAGLMLRAGLDPSSRVFQTQRAADLGLPGWLRAGADSAEFNKAFEYGRRCRGWHSLKLCEEFLRLDKRDVPHDQEGMIRAAFSGGSMTNIFTTNVNAILLAAYEEAGDTTQGWTKEELVANFMTQERPRMDGFGDLKKLPRGQTADHADRSDVGESYKISRYAQQFVIDEQDIIDDNLGALKDSPTLFGKAAARLRPNLVYAILFANANLNATGTALFDNTQGNLFGSAALDVTPLSAAISAMSAFTDTRGQSLNLQATHLIVPPAIKHTASRLLNSSELYIAGTAGSVTERGSKNPIQEENLTLVVDGRLQNGVTDPDSGTVHTGSNSTWFLASNQAHTIEVGYLRSAGTAPQVRNFTLERGQWGMGWDVKLDIGAKALDWRGLVKNQSAAL